LCHGFKEKAMSSLLYPNTAFPMRRNLRMRCLAA
jgi:hypothetical protein